MTRKATCSELATAKELAIIPFPRVVAETERQKEEWESFMVEKRGDRYAPTEEVVGGLPM